MDIREKRRKLEKVDIAIITVREDEYEAVLQCCFLPASSPRVGERFTVFAM